MAMQIRRREALPVLPSVPTCPAALIVHGAVPANSGVVCRSMERDRAAEKGIDMNPAQLAVARSGGVGDVFLTLKSDPSTIERLCCGDGVPVLHDGEMPGGRDTYTFCPIKQAEVWAAEHGQKGLGSRIVEPETWSHYDPNVKVDDGAPPAGSTHAAADPWAQARADLDVLAPPSAPTGG